MTNPPKRCTKRHCPGQRRADPALARDPPLPRTDRATTEAAILLEHASDPARPRIVDPTTASERDQILAALAAAPGNQKVAAQIVGVSRRTLINRLEQYGIARPRKTILELE